MSLQISSLADYPKAITLVAQWHHEQWSYLNPDRSLMEREAEMFSYMDRHQIPETFVALLDDEVVGCASLLAHDMDTRMDLGPWFGSLYVVPECRHQGIGTALVGHVTKEARSLGWSELYLYSTDASDYYAKQGWDFFSEEAFHDHPVVIMRQSLGRWGGAPAE